MYRFLAITLLLSVAAQQVLCQGPPDPDQQEKCDDCGDKVEEMLDGLRDAIKESEPVCIKNIGSCEECNVTELYTVKKDGEICPVKQQDESIQQDMELGFDNVHAECLCTMKDDKGEDQKGKVIIDWANGRVRTVLNIKEETCTVVRGAINCDQPKCSIQASDLDIKCEGSDDFNKACEDGKGDLGCQVMTNVAEGAFPGCANEQVNKNPKLIKLFKCDA